MKLSKTMKKVVIILGIILVLVFSAYALFELKVAKYEEKEEVYYAYQSRGNIDYKVFLRPNLMYEQEYLGKERYYVLDYIDHVDIKFKYEFKGSTPAILETDYLVKAYLQGLHGREDEVLWSKEFILVPKKVERSESSEKVIEITVPVTLDEYLTLKEIIFHDSEVNSPVVLNVVFDLRTLVSTEKGTREDKMSPNIVIPIGENVFQIDCAPEIVGKDAITELINLQLPVDTGKVTIFFVFSFLFLVITVLAAIFIQEAVPPDTFDKTLAGIFKEYGERLAGLEQAIPDEYSDLISINSVEDMVKIADEVGQPVFYYKVNTRLERKIEFYVFDSSRIYYMVIFGEIKPEAESLPPVEIDRNDQISI
jgi:hypothetical protein